MLGVLGLIIKHLQGLKKCCLCFVLKAFHSKKKLEILSKINLESLFSNISAEVILAMLDLRQAAGSELRTLVLARVQLNLAMPQIGRRDLFSCPIDMLKLT